MPSVVELELDGVKYKWVHNGCFCMGHCGTDDFFVDGEPYGSFDNDELCSFVMRLMEIAKHEI